METLPPFIQQFIGSIILLVIVLIAWQVMTGGDFSKLLNPVVQLVTSLIGAVLKAFIPLFGALITGIGKITYQITKLSIDSITLLIEQVTDERRRDSRQRLREVRKQQTVYSEDDDSQIESGVSPTSTPTAMPNKSATSKPKPAPKKTKNPYDLPPEIIILDQEQDD